MSNDTVVSLAAPALVPDPLTELLRSGARRLVEAAVRAEFEEHLSSFGHEKLPDGRQRVVRNGRLPERKILTGLGEVDVRVPKARSRSGSPEPFRSSVAPPYVRRCASLDAAIPWLYLHGVSTGQMRQAVAALVGEPVARGLSANVVGVAPLSWTPDHCAEEVSRWQKDVPPYAPEYRRQMVCASLWCGQVARPGSWLASSSARRRRCATGCVRRTAMKGVARTV